MDYSFTQINSVTFKLLSKSEAKKLSVLPISSVQTFDLLGHPLDNGLCDTALGPLKRNDFCRTCGLTECLGHFGHIQLPLPVFNPFLIKETFQVLKMFCFECHHLLFTPFNLEIYIAQIRAIDMGLDYILDDIFSFASAISQASKGYNWNSFEGKTYLRSKLNEMINCEFKKSNVKLSKELDIDNENAKVLNLESVEIVNSKNVIEKKQGLFKKLFNCKIIKPNRACVHCNARKHGLNIVNKSLIIMSTGGKAIANAEKNEEQEIDKIDLKGKAYLTPSQARCHFRKLWENEKDILVRLFPFINIDFEDSDIVKDEDDCPMDVFFWDTIVVSPNRFRPLRHVNNRSFEHFQTHALSEIMLVAKSLEQSLENAKSSNSGENITRFHFQWQKLQLLCNRIYDSGMDTLPDNKAVGVKQVLEKKEGLMRKNMMGKRVNFAARSVISPDPYIMVDEIGVPVIFATKLSYPQPVTNWNVKQLQEMIINGPNKHPGALSIIYEDGFTVRLKSDDIAQRRSIAATLHPPSFNQNISGVKIVNRHLITGDVMLLNRQPTLHKPSIMAHKARVLPKEKTLRLHYANCKCYNADFDGDEMNAHFPQSELARSEAYNLASVNYQYLVPKDGSPLSGLIQDHIVAGVFISVRGRFFNKNDYQELVYGAISFLNQPVKLVAPSIIKPNCLWSGKQIITTLLLNIIPEGKPLPSFEIESKVSPKLLTVNKPRPWTTGGPLNSKDMCESQVLFRHGELLCGIMDKSNFGATKNGLIHICYELYGGDIHLKLLTAIARLCTNFLQSHMGFTLDIEDILVRPKSDSKRKKLIQNSSSIGLKAVSTAFNVDNDLDVIEEKLRIAHTSKNDILMKQLDNSYKSQTALLNDQITNICMPKGLMKKFPDNNLQMMIQTGAKGGSVNAIQISCLLGQIELEGRRIPLMMSGRTLPSFRPYETEPRAGGFVTGRFLSGIRPQEFFFHCMAGREGLIDTAVKTSRSGYLQRCLIKHLEGLVVNYDLTVRDSEGSVIQWLYGEDGLDISKSQSLKKSFFPVIKSNIETLKPRKEEQAKFIQNLPMIKEVEKVKKHLMKIMDQNTKIRNENTSPFLLFEQKQKLNDPQLGNDYYKKMWYDLDMKQKQNYFNGTSRKLDPIIPRYRPDLIIGAISESLSKSINEYIRTNLENCSKEFINEFCHTLNHCYIRSLCPPGEAVGLLAAQSIGEPSTQMTLNTFHFAGRGEMNVTLGVPRLRELLMTASSSISTPSMDIPFRTDLDESVNLEKKAESIRLRLNAVRLKDVLEYVDIADKIEIKKDSYFNQFRIYDIRFQFLPKIYYKRRCFTNPKKILYFMENIFIQKFIEALNRRIRLLTKSDGLFDSKIIRNVNRSSKTKKISADVDEEELLQQDDGDKNVDDDNKASFNVDYEDDDDDDLDDYDVDVGEGDTTAMRQRSRINQEQEYEEPDDEELEMANEDEIEDGYSSNDESKQQTKIKQEITDEDQLGVKQQILDEDSKGALIVEDEKLKNEAKNRRNKLMSKMASYLLDYNFDVQEELWCEIKLKFPILGAKLDIRSILEEEANQAFVYRVGRIDRAFLEKDFEAAERGAKFTKLIRTEGVSMAQMVEFENYLDIRRIYTNDMHQIARTYGIEAARAALIREIKNVFAVYGISVDGRHLSLIADHMTFTGQIKGMNRGAMDGISPLQAMTFETTTNFLKNSLLLDLKDDLQSPSSRLVIGRPTVVGTGLFETRLKPEIVNRTPVESMTSGICEEQFSKKPSTSRLSIGRLSNSSTKSFLPTSMLSNLFDSTKRGHKLKRKSHLELSNVNVKEEIEETETIVPNKKKLKLMKMDHEIKTEFE